MCGVDSGISQIKAHGSLAASIAAHVDAGIPVEESLAAATSVSATECGLPGKGRIRAGADADLLLVDGDPREDVAALGRVAGVVLGGRRVPGSQTDSPGSPPTESCT